MAQAVMSMEQLAELTNRLVVEHSAWGSFVASAIDKIVARLDIANIDKLIETMQKFIRQEIMYQELMAQVDQPIAEILQEAVAVYRRECCKNDTEKRICRVILKKPAKVTELPPSPYDVFPINRCRSDLYFSAKEPKALRTTTKGTQRLRRPAHLWSPEESERLREIMSKQQSIERIEWTAVAHLLGTGRTSAQCAQHWFRVLNPELHKQEWRIDEDGDLLDLYKVHKTKWSTIASFMKGRSDTQCRNRYLKIKAASKRPWLENEDAMLFSDREKNMSWEEISEHLFRVSAKKSLIRYPIVCKMRYTELTGIDTEYEEIGIGEGARNRAADVEMSTSDIPLNKC